MMWRTRCFFATIYLSLLFVGIFNIEKMSFGDWSGEGTPGNIPNPVVKLASADGTWGAAPWESRSLPKDFFYLTQADIIFRLLGLS